MRAWCLAGALLAASGPAAALTERLTDLAPARQVRVDLQWAPIQWQRGDRDPSYHLMSAEVPRIEYRLDVARYAESNGNDGLSRNPSFPHAWRYRDYVIRAINEDVPYDRFIAEQIAGDLLPADSPAQRDRQRRRSHLHTIAGRARSRRRPDS